MNAAEQITDLLTKTAKLRWEAGPHFHDSLMEAIYTDAAQIADRAITRTGEKPRFS
ncbi:MAG: hypothetical protein O3B73_02825 [bacterium]|nr:hypothetical protein [bacterium]